MVLAFDNFQTYNEPKQNKTKLHYYKETSPWKQRGGTR